MPLDSSLLMSHAFAAALDHLAPQDRRRVGLTIAKLCTYGPRHPGLQVHRLLSVPVGVHLWVAYVSGKSLRLVFEHRPADKTFCFWLVGSHHILDAAKRLSRRQDSLLPIHLDTIEVH